jgi:hypothetical protein
MKLFFMAATLRALSDGRFFRRAFAVVLAVVAVIVGLAGALGVFALFAALTQYGSSLPSEALLGAVIFIALLVVGTYMVVHTIGLRARDIVRLPDTGFTMIPILSIFLKLAGEVLACYAIIGGVSACVLSWLASGLSWRLYEAIRQAIGPFAQFLPIRSFIGQGSPGWEVLIPALAGLLAGFFQLAVFYLLSEAVLVIADIAVNIRHLRRRADGLATAVNSGGGPGAPKTPLSNGSAGAARCPSCGAPADQGSGFCEDCGAVLTATRKE